MLIIKDIYNFVMKEYKNVFIATTDTVVGIGAPISKENEEALYEIKQRPKNKPIIIMVGDIENARKLEGWNENAEELAKKYWPGNVTLVLTESIAVRMPDCKPLQEMIKKHGAVYMTSANISGEKQLTFEQACEKFSYIKNTYNFCEGSGKPSMIIDVNTKNILRK